METDNKTELVEGQNFDQKLIAKIKEEKIAPKPRWHFLLKNSVIWGVGLLALLIGAASVSVMIYLFKYNDLDIWSETHSSLGETILLILPYFWLIFLGLFVFILYYNIKHTKSGYRYSMWLILVVSVFTSIILGSGLFWAGFGEKIDLVLSQEAPLYDRVINPRVDFWSRPDEGRLVGLVAAATGQQFILVDREQTEWQVTISPDEARNNQGNIDIIVGLPIRLLGKKISDHEFVAEHILPLIPGRGFFGRPRMPEADFHCLPQGCHPHPIPENNSFEPGN